ncbi:hypothetical protein EIN_062910 [Entamoeba invadens IP1]|uniref:hypothetical protein n=1 Tax=Entamoeba invadens IP1 TaxID=370355 RepID=UPI0002C3F0FA|nr:hypothetical protein EIN_062910 [Entamoeba invadens IP1]ELP93586.1 hypothetical protein EIN_062910 [Entamoeba invadens IP1]|eukprot:XP_004260357.1 hypothetical protein EIN_062910 [Entamoeba invadens IP1]
MIAILLLVVFARAQPFINMYGQQLPYVEEQESFRAEQVLHGLNMKFMQLREELYRSKFDLRATQRRRYFSNSPMELFGSEHELQFMQLKEIRLTRTINIILKQMAHVLVHLSPQDRNMVVMHLGIPRSTISAMKKALKTKIPDVPSMVPMVGPQMPFF